MDKKMRTVGLVAVLAAVCTLLCFGFIVLDVSVLGWTAEQLDGPEGLGVAVIIALFLMFALPAAVVNAIFQIVCGGAMIRYEKRGCGVHKALRIVAAIVGILAALIYAFFAYCFFDGECIVWAIFVALATVMAIAVPILSAVAHKEA